MNTDQLRRDLLGRAQQAPTPGPDLAEQVLQRRRAGNRRRAGLLGAALAIVLVLIGVPLTIAAIRGISAPVAAGKIYTAPTRGSLAADNDFLAGLQQQPWQSNESYSGADGSRYSAGTDLAADIPAADRNVAFAADVPGGRWALLSIRAADGYAAAWFTGPVGAAPDQMAMSGPMQFVTEGEPMAHVDLSNVEQTLVVVAASGDDIFVSPEAELSGTGMYFRTSFVMDAPDGVAVTQVNTTLPFGIAAVVSVERNGQDIYRARPTASGTLPGKPPWGDHGWNPEDPDVLANRNGVSLAVAPALADAMLDSALGPTGLTLRDLSPVGPPITELFSGDRNGPATRDRRYRQPTITIWSIKMPSGSYVVVGGWSAIDADDVVTYEQTLLSIRFEGDDPALGVVANRMQLPAYDGAPASDVLVISGPVNGVRAEIQNTAGEVLNAVDLTDGAAVVPSPAGAEVVRVADDAGMVTQGLLSDNQYPDTTVGFGDSRVILVTTIPGR